MGNSVVRPSRRQFIAGMLSAALAGSVGGCGRPEGRIGQHDLVWGRRGIIQGRFQKPRAIAIDPSDRLYIVDMTARIQVFDVEGNYLRGWQTPVHANGRPTGLTATSDGRILVADTHYFRVLQYTSEGDLLEDRTIGGTHGNRPGEFGFVTDAVEDSTGAMYVAEYGEFDRIQKFSPQGEFLLEWGSHGKEPGQFVRPQSLAVDGNDRLWVSDSCNHRIQVFDSNGILLGWWGNEGTSLEELYYPYCTVFDQDENLVVCEYGNNRIQKFTPDGKSLGCWGEGGRKPGQLFNPWALVVDSQGRLHVLDSNNHRVQRVIL